MMWLEMLEAELERRLRARPKTPPEDVAQGRVSPEAAAWDAAHPEVHQAMMLANQLREEEYQRELRVAAANRMVRAALRKMEGKP